MFEQLGYFKEYYIGLKFIGTCICDKDRDIVGYNGKKTEILSDVVILDNGKRIKPNTEVTTILYPLTGRKNG